MFSTLAVFQPEISLLKCEFLENIELISSTLAVFQAEMSSLNVESANNLRILVTLETSQTGFCCNRLRDDADGLYASAAKNISFMSVTDETSQPLRSRLNSKVMLNI